ncbi:putative low-density lipoprotein receptor-related protein 8 [Apostichopus japonicus]|uniref:Putative low-density lipoprotein receptor-related protein 8 n=1 Tax=Stichopus japonicus TaxID=307972 RepID=A0A2G8L6Q6_STIJA|nr:putative low-density lipoprotein receptor-related protein 8 [Apostichopus japonicus]
MASSCVLGFMVHIMFLGVSSACAPTSVRSNLQITRPSYFKVRECGQRPLYQDMRRRKRVTNGDEARIGQWPWHVNIQENGRPPCSGVLIDSDWVVTAAHCFYDKWPKRKLATAADLTVTAGTLNSGADSSPHSKTTAEVRLVTDVFMHPLHAAESSLDNYDFIILKLAEPFILGPYIQTACIQIEDDAFEPGAECYAAGWGQYYISNTEHSSDSLQYSSVPLLSQTECKSYARNVSRYQLSLVTDQKLCAGVWNGDNYGPCKGDSGGALVCYENTSRSWFVTGVVSHGPKCGEVGFYTKVYAMLAFVDKVLSGGFTNDNYTCSDGIGKIPVERKCDGEPDCADDSDETHCECTENQFQCDNGICQMLAHRCDTKNDCGDLSDEVDCEYFQCHSNQENISKNQVCDGVIDCKNDTSDEDPDLCECNTSSHFQCPNGPCIPLSWTCDGQEDCITTDMDEVNCTTACREGYFACNNGKCTHTSNRCDRGHDCDDRSDELNCNLDPCPEGTAECGPISKDCLNLTMFSCDRETTESLCHSGDTTCLSY